MRGSTLLTLAAVARVRQCKLIAHDSLSLSSYRIRPPDSPTPVSQQQQTQTDSPTPPPSLSSDLRPRPSDSPMPGATDSGMFAIAPISAVAIRLVAAVAVIRLRRTSCLQAANPGSVKRHPGWPALGPVQSASVHCRAAYGERGGGGAGGYDQQRNVGCWWQQLVLPSIGGGSGGGALNRSSCNSRCRQCLPGWRS